MTDPLTGIAVGLAAGAVLGLLFYGGLWLTVQRVATGGGPRVLLLLSFVLRLAVAGAGLFLLGRLGVWPLVGGALGFVLVRPLITRAVTRAVAGAAGAPGEPRP